MSERKPLVILDLAPTKQNMDVLVQPIVLLMNADSTHMKDAILTIVKKLVPLDASQKTLCLEVVHRSVTNEDD